MRQTVPLLIAMLLCACGTSATSRPSATAPSAPRDATGGGGAPATPGGSPSSGPPAVAAASGTPAPVGSAGISPVAPTSAATRGTATGTALPTQRPTATDVCPPPPPPGSGACPNPCTCPDFYVTGDRWPTDSSGHATIHYRINPSGVTSPLSPQQLIAAITAGAQAWMDADPAVELVYDGTTTSPPALDNVVGFVDNGAPGTTDGGMGRPFDIQLAASGWVWQPCDPAHAVPCTAYDSGSGAYDLQQVVTHEWGHVLGVGHAPNTDDAQLTMFGTADGACPQVSSGYTCRYADTLGYGDVLGERALYPSSAPFTLYYP